MRLTVILFSALLSGIIASAQSTLPINSYKAFFEEAYQENPQLPAGILEAVAFTNSRFQHITHSIKAESCIGIPKSYGVMGLVEDGKGYFKNNLALVAGLSQYSTGELKSEPRKHILGYAVALASSHCGEGNAITDYHTAIEHLSALPTGTAGQEFAKSSETYAIYEFLNTSKYQKHYKLPQRTIDMVNLFGKENLRVLRVNKVIIGSKGVKTQYGHQFKLSGPCIDYPNTIWTPADPSNWSSRNGTPISAVTVHDIEGSYAGAISWFQNPIANVSAHYVLRSFDGQITQMVCESEKGWHVGTENPYTIGLEHEGYASLPGWYSAAMYQASANLVKDICTDNGINPLRTYAGPACSGSSPQCQLGACIKIKGHQMYPNQTHSDPGIYWDWEHYYRLINDSFSITAYSTPTGNFYDTGGATSNYGDDERTFWLIDPPGDTIVDMNFTSFDLEANWDYLYIYDGISVNNPLIGVYTDTNSPGNITAHSGSFYIEFRSDCATTSPGWEASWNQQASPACTSPVNLNAVANPFGSSLSWDPVAGATEYIVLHRLNLESTWSIDTTITNSLTINGLSSNALYYWRVRALCGQDTSAYSGASFTTNPAQSSTTTECTGTFRDSGGELSTYYNNENYDFTISPPGATSISVNFGSFDVETNWDYLYIYDGPTTGSPQIVGSPFTGTNSPGSFISTGSSVTFQFTSDVSTVNAGWEATWSCSGVPTASFTSSSGFICEGDSLIITNTSQNAISYQWEFAGGSPAVSTSINPSVAYDSSGTYQITLVAIGSTTNDTLQQNVSVTIEPAVVANYQALDTMLFLPNAIGIFNNSSLNGTSYWWDFGDGNIGTDANPWHQYQDTGYFTVTLVAYNPTCPADTLVLSNYIYVSGSTGINETDVLSDLEVFPNPFTNEVTLQFGKPTEATISLQDALGRCVYREFAGGYAHIINASQLAHGIYFVQIEAKGIFAVRKIVKQ